MDTSVWLLIGALVLLLMAGAAAVLLVRVIRARKLLVDAGIPLRDKALFWASVIYTVSPVDLLPDPVYLDDIGFLLLALRSLHAAAQKAGCGAGSARRDTGGVRTGEIRTGGVRRQPFGVREQLRGRKPSPARRCLPWSLSFPTPIPPPPQTPCHPYPRADGRPGGRAARRRMVSSHSARSRRPPPPGRPRRSTAAS